MVLFGPKIDEISKKKGLRRNLNGFSGRIQVISKKKKKKKRSSSDLKKKGLRQNFNGFSGRIQVISKKKTFANTSTVHWLMGSLNTMGPGVIVPPAPSSRRPWQ